MCICSRGDPGRTKREDDDGERARVYARFENPFEKNGRSLPARVKGVKETCREKERWANLTSSRTERRRESDSPTNLEIRVEWDRINIAVILPWQIVRDLPPILGTLGAIRPRARPRSPCFILSQLYDAMRYRTVTGVESDSSTWFPPAYYTCPGNDDVRLVGFTRRFARRCRSRVSCLPRSLSVHVDDKFK